MGKIKPKLFRAFWWLAGLFLALLVFSGCITTFKHPLTAPSAQAPDKQIMGTWVTSGNNEGESGFIHMGPDKDTGEFKVIMVTFESDGKMDLAIWRGHTSKLAPGSYLNLKWVLPEENKIKGYLVVKYVITGDRMNIYAVEDDVIEKDIKSKKLTGQIDQKNGIYVTQDTDALSRYVAKNDARLFTKETILIRNLVKLSSDNCPVFK